MEQEAGGGTGGRRGAGVVGSESEAGRQTPPPYSWLTPIFLADSDPPPLRSGCLPSLCRSTRHPARCCPSTTTTLTSSSSAARRVPAQAPCTPLPPEPSPGKARPSRHTPCYACATRCPSRHTRLPRARKRVGALCSLLAVPLLACAPCLLVPPACPPACCACMLCSCCASRTLGPRRG